MKKWTRFILVCLIILLPIIYFMYGKHFFELLEEKKVYSVKNIQSSEIHTMDDYEFFNEGIITYNNKKIVFLKYNDDVIFSEEDSEFTKQVFIAGDTIFKKDESAIHVVDKSGQSYIITEVSGDLINVSRENGKIYMIVKNEEGLNYLYVLNDNYDIIVDGKYFTDKITGVSISDRSEGYSLITFRYENGNIVNTVYFNLLDDVELWKAEIKDEILLKVQIVNNNVILLGTKNIYYYNINGKLMWKNSVYNKISDFEISKEGQKIYLLFERNGYNELITYNFEGKVLEVNKAPAGTDHFKIYGNKIFLYNNNMIFLIHNGKTDKIYDDETSYKDFILDGKTVYILYKDKLVKGQIK